MALPRTVMQRDHEACAKAGIFDIIFATERARLWQLKIPFSNPKTK